MAWDSHHWKTGSRPWTRKGHESVEDLQIFGPRPSSVTSSDTDTRADMSRIGTEDAGQSGLFSPSGPPPLVVHCSIRFTDPIIRSTYHRTYRSSPRLDVTDRICNGLLRRIEHCSEELITRKDSGALERMFKDGSTAQKPMRYEMKFRVFRRATGAWAERSFKSFQKHPLTVEAAKEIVLSSHRIIGLYLKRHDKDFEMVDGGIRTGTSDRPELMSPSLDRPISPLYVPQTQLGDMSFAADAEFMPGYTIQLSFQSRSHYRKGHWFRRMLDIASKQTAPLTVSAVEDLLWQGVQDIQQRLQPVKQEYQKHVDACLNPNCQHSGEGALQMDLQVINSLGPLTDQKHRNVSSKLLMFREVDFKDCKRFLFDLEKTFTDARDRLDQEINGLDDFEFQVLEVKGRQSAKDWGWSVEEPVELRFRLGPSDVYSRRTIEAALDRIQTGVGDVIRGHNVAVRFKAHKRGHELLDKAIVAKEKPGKPKERFPSPDTQKAAIVSRLQQRIQYDLNMVCKDTCSIDDMEEESLCVPKREVASVAAVGAAALVKPAVLAPARALPPLCVEKLSRESAIEIASGPGPGPGPGPSQESPKTTITPSTPTRPSSSRSFSLVSFPRRDSSAQKEKVKPLADFLIASESRSKTRTSEHSPAPAQSSPSRPATEAGLLARSPLSGESVSIPPKEPILTITSTERKVVIMEEPQKEGRSLRRFASIKNTVKKAVARRSLPFGSKNQDASSSSSSRRPSTASNRTRDFFASLSESPLSKKRHSSAMMERPVTAMPISEPSVPSRPQRPMTAMPDRIPAIPKRAREPPAERPATALPVSDMEGFLLHCDDEEQKEEEDDLVTPTAVAAPATLAVRERADEDAPSEAATEIALSFNEFAYITDAEADSEAETTAPSTPGLSSGSESSPRHSLLITPRHLRGLSGTSQLEDADQASANEPHVSESGSTRMKNLGAHPEGHRATAMLPLPSGSATGIGTDPASEATEGDMSGSRLSMEMDLPASTPSTISLPEATPEPKEMEIATDGLDSVPTLSGLQPFPSATASSGQELVSETFDQERKEMSKGDAPIEFIEQLDGALEPAESPANETPSVPETPGWLEPGWLEYTSTDAETQTSKEASGSQHPTGLVDGVSVASVSNSAPSGPVPGISGSSITFPGIEQNVKLSRTPKPTDLTERREAESATVPEFTSISATSAFRHVQDIPEITSGPTEEPIGGSGRSASDLVSASGPVAEVRAKPAFNLETSSTRSVRPETTRSAQIEVDHFATISSGPDATPAGSDAQVLAPERSPSSPQRSRVSDDASLGGSLGRVPSGPSDWPLSEGTTAALKAESEVAGSGFSGSIIDTLRTLRTPASLKQSAAKSNRSSSISMLSDAESYYSDSVSTVIPEGRGSVDTVPRSSIADESGSFPPLEETHHHCRPCTAGYLGLHETRLVDMGLRGALTGTKRFSLPLQNINVLAADGGQFAQNSGRRNVLKKEPSSISLVRRQRKEIKLQRKTKSTSDAVSAVASRETGKEDVEQAGGDVVLPRVMMFVGAVAVATRLWQKSAGS